MKHGKELVFKLDNGAGVITDLTSHVKSVDLPQTIETSDETTAGNTAKVYIPGLTDAQLSINGPFSPAIDAHMDGIIGKVGSFEYSPEGTATGSPKKTGECILTSYNPSSSVSGGAVQYSAQFQVTGPVARGVN